MEQPLISIVMPTYNRGGYILETIESIINQTYTNWELLIMDDGSDDDTAKIVRSIKDSRIKYHNEGRIGITGTLKNKGMKLAAGALIAFMDSDDLWPKLKLETQLHLLLQYPEAGFAFTNACNFRDTDKQVIEILYKRDEGAISADFFQSICKGETGIYMPTVMLWRKHIDESMLFRENRAFTDFSFITNLASRHKGIIIYNQLLQRRIHGNNNTSLNWVADYEEHIETILRYKSSHQLSAPLADAILFLTNINLGEEYMKYGMRKQARATFIHAWPYKPLSIIPLKKIVRSFLKRR